MSNGAKMLREWITRSKLNQVQAAAHLGVHEAFVSMLVNGRRCPGRTTAVKIARLTGIPVEAWSESDLHSKTSRRRPAAVSA